MGRDYGSFIFVLLKLYDLQFGPWNRNADRAIAILLELNIAFA